MESYMITGKDKFTLKAFSTDETQGMSKKEAIEKMNQNLPKIDELQKKLYAEKKESIIFLFQAMDAAGKDGTIQAVLSCLSPHGVKEYAFKAPTSEELEHDFLWRIHKCIPSKGHIAIFNRSHYEDVLIGRVHKLYLNQLRADYIDEKAIINDRYEDIRHFEKYLYNNSVRVVKIFLNVSKEEQAKRFLSRLEESSKNWKFSEGDVEERKYWDEYQGAFEAAINETATKHCPWFVVPADKKWYMRYVVSQIILDTLQEINPKYPEVSEEQLKSYEKYKEQLEKELE